MRQPEPGIIKSFLSWFGGYFITLGRGLDTIADLARNGVFESVPLPAESLRNDPSAAASHIMSTHLFDTQSGLIVCRVCGSHLQNSRCRV